MRFVVIGSPENRRVGLFQAALAGLGLPRAEVVTYQDLLAHRDHLERFGPGTMVRFDSPERDFEVEKALIAAGAATEGTHQQIDAELAMALGFDRGRILYPRQGYLGWRRWLSLWAGQLRVPAMNHPHDIAAMFDKPLCQERFARLGLPVPRPLGPIQGYAHLRERMAELGCDRVFVKLSHGSSASGVVAYRTTGSIEEAVTTVERVGNPAGTIYYNSRKIRRYTRRREIEEIIDYLAAEGVQVEEWLPKARLGGLEFDLRVVVIAGVARHTVVRQARQGPMTNLHLGNERGDFEEFLNRTGDECWQAMRRTCERAALAFPGSLYSGVDLLVAPDFDHHAVLEINAFGDLLPGVLWNDQDTYTSEVQATLETGFGTVCR